MLFQGELLLWVRILRANNVSFDWSLKILLSMLVDRGDILSDHVLLPKRMVAVYLIHIIIIS